MEEPTILKRTVNLLFPFLWPKRNNKLKVRVILAVMCLVSSKATNLISPPILGSAVDSLTELSNGLNTLTIIPLALIVAYGLSRIATKLFGEMRNAIFSKVSQNAIRQLTLNTFAHLHSLSLKFHLNRKTGALSKFIDRGTKGIDFLKCSPKEALSYQNKAEFTIFGSPVERSEWTCLLNKRFKSIANQ